jgi:hypothetical protein
MQVCKSNIYNFNFYIMNELNFERMEEVKGGDFWQCAGGWAGLAFLAGCGIFAPGVTYAVILTGEGAMLAVGITEQSLYAIYHGC